MQDGSLLPCGNDEGKSRSKHTFLPFTHYLPVVDSPDDLGSLRLQLLNDRFLTDKDSHLSLVSDTIKISCDLLLGAIDALGERWNQDRTFRIQSGNLS